MKMIQLYQFQPEYKIIDSFLYGPITYYEWLIWEKRRIEKGKGRFAEIRKRKNAYSLFVNQMAEV